MAREVFDRIAWLYDALTRLSGRGRRYARIIEQHAELKKTSVVLDIGGGNGVIAKHLSNRVKNITVLDPSAKMLAKARALGLRTARGSAARLPFEKERFDVVYCVDALHHFTNGKRGKQAVEKSVQEMLRVLKPGGKIVIVEFDPQKIGGKVVRFMENTLFRWNSTFYTPAKLEKLFTPHKTSIPAYRGHEYALIVTKKGRKK